MRALFGVVSLLIVLAIVVWTVRGSPGPRTPTARSDAPQPGAAPALPGQQVQRDLDAALAAGAARNDAAERGAASADGAGSAAR